VLRSIQTAVDLVRARTGSADLSIFHEFTPPAYGGGHQFVRALGREVERRGFVVETNRIAPDTPACLYNSFNFDFDRLRRFARAGCRMVHRVDGPVGVYRGADDGTDRRIWEINRDLANATVFQSEYSLRRHEKLGLRFVNPVVIHNASDPAIFNTTGRSTFLRSRRTRLIAVSWSDNPNKGAATYAWLERHLDWERFEFSFVGRSPVGFERIQSFPTMPPSELAALLRTHDVFVFASRHEACSNSLIEALSSGLPAIYLDSGSNAELVGQGGFGFREEKEIPDLLGRIVEEYEARQQSIVAPRLTDVADRYLDVLGLRATKTRKQEHTEVS